MKDREDIINEFIESFYKKSKTNRRNSKNSILYLTDLTNRVCSKYFGEKFNFTEEEIIKGFEHNNFLIMEPKDDKATIGKIVKGKIIISIDYYVNSNSREATDLYCSLNKSLPKNTNPETLSRIDELKNQLKEFVKQMS